MSETTISVVDESDISTAENTSIVSEETNIPEEIKEESNDNNQIKIEQPNVFKGEVLASVHHVNVNGKRTIVKTWEEVQEDLEPFTVILFRGRDLVSTFISGIEYIVEDEARDLKFGIWSHVGILVNGEVMECKNLGAKQWAVYEMTCTGKIAGDPTPDLETGKGRFGTQVRDFRSVLETYPGRVAILKLKDNPYRRKEGEDDINYKIRLSLLRMKASKFKHDHHHTLYQFNVVQLAATAFPCLRWLRTFFPISKYWQMCSDISAAFYKAIGVFPQSIETNNVLPMDFLSDSDGAIKSEWFLPPPIQITLTDSKKESSHTGESNANDLA